MLRGTAPVAGLMGAWQGLNTPTEDYAARMGVDYPETFAGELGVRTAGVLSDVGTAFVDPFIELGNLATGGDVPTMRSTFADVEAAGGTGASLPAQLAGAEAIAPPAPGQAGAPVDTRPAYGRAFGRGNTDGLRHPDTTYSAAMPVPQGDARVVQRTGGPGDEVIVREDVNGVPTFTNLRRGGFDGSAANLQKEADARVREDSIRERQQLALQRERAISSDPQAAATFEKAMSEATAKGSNSLEDMRNAYTSMGLFTDPETGKVDDRMYYDFVERVGAELAKQGMNINELAPAQMMQLAKEFTMALGPSQRFNQTVNSNLDINPGAVLRPMDVQGLRKAEFMRDWWGAGDNSDVGLWDAITGADVYDVNIPGADGTMTVARDDIVGNDLRSRNYYEQHLGR